MPNDDVMCSISHSVVPGERICSACGRKESLDPSWVMGQQIGRQRAACRETAAEKEKSHDA